MKPSEWLIENLSPPDGRVNEEWRDMEKRVLSLLRAVEKCPIGVLRGLPKSGFSDTSPNTYTGTILQASLALKEGK